MRFLDGLTDKWLFLPGRQTGPTPMTAPDSGLASSQGPDHRSDCPDD